MDRKIGTVAAANPVRGFIAAHFVHDGASIHRVEAITAGFRNSMASDPLLAETTV